MSENEDYKNIQDMIDGILKKHNDEAPKLNIDKMRQDTFDLFDSMQKEIGLQSDEVWPIFMGQCLAIPNMLTALPLIQLWFNKWLEQKKDSPKGAL